jgi:hypothetical protein
VHCHHLHGVLKGVRVHRGLDAVGEVAVKSGDNLITLICESHEFASTSTLWCTARILRSRGSKPLEVFQESLCSVNEDLDSQPLVLIRSVTSQPAGCSCQSQLDWILSWTGLPELFYICELLVYRVKLGV